MRIMAIDYGDARTGIAISDALGMLTGTTTVIHSWNADKTAQEIVRLVRENGVERIVSGAQRSRRTRFCRKTTTTGKSGKTQSMPWRRRSFWRAISAIFAHTRSNRTHVYRLQ